MEASALTYSGGIGLQARSPLLRLQTDERLISIIRRGNSSAFEVLFARYQARLLAFCRHLLGSREDAEDVLQEVMAAAFNAILADDRPINVRPWLYRIARNRCLNHLRRAQPIGVDSMDIHFSEHGASTADKVHARERFRLLVSDIQRLPETQRSALVLREMDALSYEQIAEAMETTVSSVKSLLVRARISLAEAAEARQLGCPQVRLELAEVAEGLRRRPGPLVRRHMRHCGRCSSFDRQLKHTNKSLAALLPIGSLSLLRKLALVHVGHSAGTGSGATGTAGVGSASASGAGASAGVTGAGAGVTGAGAGVTGATAGITSAGAGITGAGAAGAASAGGITAGVSAGGGLLTAGAGALATKAVAGLAVAIVTAGAIATTHNQHRSVPGSSTPNPVVVKDRPKSPPPAATTRPTPPIPTVSSPAPVTSTPTTPPPPAPPTVTTPPTATTTPPTQTTPAPPSSPPPPDGRQQNQVDVTVLPPQGGTASGSPGSGTDGSGSGSTGSGSGDPGSGASDGGSGTGTSSGTSSGSGSSDGGSTSGTGSTGTPGSSGGTAPAPGGSDGSGSTPAGGSTS